MMHLKLSDIAILNMKDFDNCCVINLISKNEAIELLQNAGTLQKAENLIFI